MVGRVIKLLIFDLDGVLKDCKDLHYHALNNALGSFAISREEHLSTYDGLSTKKKLEMLSAKKGLPESLHAEIYEKKQAETMLLISEFKPDNRLIEVLTELKRTYMMCVVSNSIRETLDYMLTKLGIANFFPLTLSNQDVSKSKPHPEIYMRCMLLAGCSPKETLIIEDSHIGRKGAEESGAFLCPVKDSSEVTVERIVNYCNRGYAKPQWDAGELNILIPMAGAGSRFVQAGYTFPKPLIEVNGKPMIQVVVDNLNLKANYIFIVQREHYEKYNLKAVLSLIASECKIIQVSGVTQGAACTTLLAQELINSDTPLLIANSDQFLEWDSAEFMYSMADGIDGGIATFRSTHPKWSYAKVDDGGLVMQVAEKNPISDNATVGVYYWRKGSDYVKYALTMIEKRIMANGEFYVCPVFNEAISDGKKIKIFEVEKMWGIGDPESLKYFIENYDA